MVWFWARSSLSCRKLHESNFEHRSYSFTGNKYHSSPSTPLIPLRFLTTAPVSFSRVWRQSFVIEVSDLFSFSPLSSIFDNWASISSDESPSNSTTVLSCVDSNILNL